MNIIHNPDSFVSWEHDGGPISFPDERSLFRNVEVFMINDTGYAVANYLGIEALSSPITYDEYFDSVHRERLVKEKTAEIKQGQKEILDSLEGTPENPGLWQRKYIEEITIKASFDRYDDLMKKKAYVINHGNAEEDKLEAMTAEELLSYRFVCNLDDAPPISIRRITVGAFMLRFTATENLAFKQAVEVNEDMKLMLDSLTSRTHVYLDNASITGAIALLDQAGLLESEPQDSQYGSRVEELLRDGSADEQYRVLSYI